ncbi:MAG: CreA family protein, partial [Rhodoferax sp.]
TLVYLVYSDKIIEGSPKKSVTAVPVPTNQAVPPCSSTAILC